MFATILKGLAVIILFLLVHHDSTRIFRRKTAIFNTPKQCRLIITADGQFTNKKNMLSPYESRALSNSRFKTAFCIRNAFTSSDEDFVTQHVKDIKMLINLTPLDWNHLSQSLQEPARYWVDSSEGTIHLASITQTLTLRLVLVGIFKLEPRIPPSADLFFADFARCINESWILAKGPDILSFEDNEELWDCVTAFFPSSDQFQRDENPLNVILPGYETSWRVALRMFLEIRRSSNEVWVDKMVSFALHPTKVQFQDDDDDDDDGISVEAMVSEALRLYPPTRRIRRTFRFKDGKNGAVDEIFAADIEACHLDKSIWGTDALEYKPSRFATLTWEQKEAYMPFGISPFLCPAKPVFGPRMIGMVVGVLFLALQEGGSWRLVGRDKHSANDYMSGERLSNDRSAFDDLFLYLNEEMDG
ncbi:cytochrome P450 [Aspergillus eucalypticola CBS 122712]|uniref:Cytochrome P450 n=1 Tax=Aspergillus eucalypticola (strain CBS 122712 / IBT 29274) TaxID=1448314 RepID=A0A317VWZ8_ASPEC|nr:cytochrome P450 [Aspergillus eucalypticola CBS 122712]PWY78916.1 cytochrome P450 [Aspergillus eucalypticola CBS 122712]